MRQPIDGPFLPWTTSWPETSVGPGSRLAPCRPTGVVQSRWLRVALLTGAMSVGLAAIAAADDSATIEKKLADTARYLASDELEGRGLGTKGINLAADFIAAQFAQAGLKTDLLQGAAFQKFTVASAAKLGPNNRLTLVGPPKKPGEQPLSIVLKPGQDFNPMSLSGSASFDLPLAFVGYGITGKAEKYDDYAGVDVKGKAVVVLRHEPQQADPKSVFHGDKHSEHAPFSRKVSNAYQHGAAAVIFCSDRFDLEKDSAAARKAWYQALDRLAAEHAKFKEIKDPKPDQLEAQRKKIEALMRQVQALNDRLQPEYDPLMPLEAQSGESAPRSFPVVYCRRAVVDQIVKAALGTDLAALEREIDKGPTPHSKPLEGWRAAGQVDLQRDETEAKNVIGVLEAEGPLAAETIVIGAHYDHLGLGGHGSLDPKSGAIHHGADDNASGVAALVSIARSLAAHRPKLKRRVVFVAFTGEERGLLGSGHYVRNPPFPLEKTVAMLNLDMVGRLRDDKLIVMGTGTAKNFPPLLDQINAAHGFKLVSNPTGYGPSDQMVFYGREIPVLHFFTGTHADYHRPSDTSEKLNIPGMRRIATFAADVALALADAPAPPEYVAVAPAPLRMGGDRPYLGTMPDFTRQTEGYAIAGVAKGGPAEHAGLRGGDVLIQFGENKIGGLEDIDSALRKHKAGDRVRTVVRRGKEDLTLEITLDPPR
jgi:hypothetical protein